MSINFFGTDGIRTRVGHHPLTIQAMPLLGYAIAQWLLAQSHPNYRIAIAHDTRSSSSFLKAACKTGMLLHSITIDDLGTLPTPALCKIIKETENYAGGIMLTASHNPAHDNGIKVINHHGSKVNLPAQKEISQIFAQQLTHQAIYNYTNKSTARVWDCTDIYLNTVTDLFPKKMLNSLKIVVDCAHGAASSVAPIIFKQLGANIIAINNTPDGTNINNQCGPLHPASLQQAVLKNKATMGFAFDGDADRVVVINHEGTIISGDNLLALLTDHPLYREQPTVVGTIMSNHAFDIFLKNRGKQLIRTNVGDIHIAQELIKQNNLLGGEPAGHIIMRDYLDSSDGIVAALRIAETVLLTNNWNMNTFNPYPQVINNIVLPAPQCTDSTFALLSSHYARQLPHGRIILRRSGTEHDIVRIMVEDIDQHHATMVCNQVVHTLKTTKVFND